MPLVEEGIAVEVVFHDYRESDPSNIPPGVLELVPAPPEHPDQPEMARFVYWHGLARLRRGPGEIDCIVAPKHPTFDDMLALEFARRLLARQALPPGARVFAEYAKLVREGLRPGEVPLLRSMEGLYLAARKMAGDDLTRPAAAARFLQSWEKMAQRIMQAAEESADPYTTPLFDTPDFAAERAFLAGDRDRYRHEVQRGQRWPISLPGGPPKSSGLLLRKHRTPEKAQSVLFPDWSRHDRETPTGDPYLFLAVQWGVQHWVFSTDPKYGLSLQSLHAQLQDAEVKQDPQAAAQHPWSLRFGETLVANDKSQLADKTIEKLVKRWARKRPLSTPEERFQVAMLVCGLLFAAMLASVIGISLRSSTAAADDVVFADSASAIDWQKPVGGVAAMTKKLTLDAGEEGSLPFRFAKRYDTNWQARLEVSCTSSGTVPPDRVEVQLDGKRFPAPQGEPSYVTPVVDLQPKDNVAEVFLRNPASAPLTFTVRLSCRPEEVRSTLHVLAVGVASDGLESPDEDARAIADFFRNCDNPYFDVRVHEPLIDEEAKFGDIASALSRVADQVQRQDVFLLTLAGHGSTRGDLYFFQPWDFNAKARWEKQNAFTWADLVKFFPLNCRAVVFLDTCHAGQAAADIDWLTKSDRESFVLAACAPDKGAYERDGHGHFTRALLEAVGHFPSPGLLAKLDHYPYGELTLGELLPHLRGRVNELSSGRQSVQCQESNQAVPEIPLVSLPGERPSSRNPGST